MLGTLIEEVKKEIMREILTVNNIKCGGCEATVRNGLSKIKDVENIHVDSTTGKVGFDYIDEASPEKVRLKLRKMGYTENDPNFIDTAKSYVSCMMGKIK